MDDTVEEKSQISNAQNDLTTTKHTGSLGKLLSLCFTISQSVIITLVKVKLEDIRINGPQNKNS